MSSPIPNDEQAFAEWHRGQQQQVAEYLRRLQVFNTDITGEWQWIIPHRGMIGQVRPKQGTSPVLWVITGIVPTDHAEAGAGQAVPQQVCGYGIIVRDEDSRRVHGSTIVA